MEGLPPNVQHQIQQFQQMQQRYELLLQQRQQLELNLRDTERALEDLEKASEDTPVYKTVGAIMIRMKKEPLVTELKDTKETYEMRLKTLQRQEERVKTQLQEMQKNLQEILQKRGAGGPGEFQPM